MSDQSSGRRREAPSQPSRRRKRPRYGSSSSFASDNANNKVESVEIPGVPPDLTPLLLQALRSTAKCLQHDATRVLLLRPDSGDIRDDPASTATQAMASTSASAILQASVMESILDRMAPSEDPQQVKRLERMEQDRQTWIDEVKRHASTRPSNHQPSSSSSSTSSSRSVPVSCFDYLWNHPQQQHSRVPIRRAALWLAGTLLQKSSECRRFLVDDNEGGLLMTWVQCISQAPHNEWKHPQEASEHVPLWQQEALLWLSHLRQEYGTLYPQFKVAYQYLQQHCPALVEQEQLDATAATGVTTGTITNEPDSFVASSLGSSSMADLRNTRDVAMRHGNRYLEKVEKLIRRGHACLDVLVPRFGDEGSVPSNAPLEIGSDDADDDDEIDWEEGDGARDALQQSEISVSENHYDNHAAAVERTLAVMESAGGLQGGTLEISFAAGHDERQVVAAEPVLDTKTLAVLRKAVDSLSVRHMPRLTSWVDALTRADGLVLQGQSLLTMSVEQARSRAALLERLVQAKRTVASLLSSARRLGVHREASTNDQQGDLNRGPIVASSSMAVSGRHGRMLAGAARRRLDGNVAQRRSNRVQIKYRTS